MSSNFGTKIGKLGNYRTEIVKFETMVPKSVIGKKEKKREEKKTNRD